jgi:2-pyrone-4,6-dicarboxylate lactonase
MKTIPPPDPNPVKPAYVPPPFACDAHCHVFGPGNKFPYASGRAYTPPDAPVEQLRALHAHLGISRAVIVHASCHGADMSVTLDAIASSGGAYRGVAVVAKGVTDAELERLHKGGIRGVRFNFVSHLGGAPDLDLVDSMLGRVGELGWHVVLHLDAEDILT